MNRIKGGPNRKRTEIDGEECYIFDGTDLLGEWDGWTRIFKADGTQLFGGNFSMIEEELNTDTDETLLYGKRQDDLGPWRMYTKAGEKVYGVAFEGWVNSFERPNNDDELPFYMEVKHKGLNSSNDNYVTYFARDGTKFSSPLLPYILGWSQPRFCQLGLVEKLEQTYDVIQNYFKDEPEDYDSLFDDAPTIDFIDHPISEALRGMIGKIIQRRNSDELCKKELSDAFDTISRRIKQNPEDFLDYMRYMQ